MNVMTVTRRLAALFLLAAPLGACATPPPVTAIGTAAPVVLERDLRGRTYARGVFTNTLTGQTRPFTVVLDGRWDGRRLTLREAFTFADGERDVKTWVFERIGPGRYRGVREDVVGEAEVFTDGPAIRLRYEAVVGGIAVRFEDVIERRADGAVVNRAVVSKLGAQVGTVDLIFSRSRAILR